jgi:multidrug efflux system outer membrane protein
MAVFYRFSHLHQFAGARRRSTRLALAAGAAALMAGCSLQPTYERPQAVPAPAYPQGAAYAAQDAREGPAAADIGWRDFLVDPRMQRIVQLALDNNRDLRVAALRISQTQAQLRLQQSAQLPSVNLNAGDSTTKNTSSSSGAGNRNTAVLHNDTVNLGTSWELDFFGRLQGLSDAAREQYLATTHARQALHILLVAQVASQYLTTLSYDEQLAVTAQTLAAAQESYRIVKLQYDTGTTSALDLALAESTLEKAEADRAGQQRLRAQAENALVLLVGQPLPADLPPALPLGQQAVLADIPAGLPSDLLLRRPDILQAEDVLRGENASIGVARAAFFPRISLTATAGTGSSTLGGLFKAGSGAWSFAPSLAMPLFDAGANRANLDVALIQKDIGVAQYQKAVQTAFREVSDGLAARGTYDKQLAALQRYTDTQQRRVDLSNLLYTNGTSDYLSVLTAKTDLYNAQISLVSARLNRLTSLVDLYRALGGGWLERSGDTAALQARAPEQGN